MLVVADRWPDSLGEWILLLAILAATIAAVAPLERRPAAIACVVLANVVAILILYHGLHDVSQRGLNGLSLGAIYALGAVGLTLVYGILKLVNFAHGDFLTFGAYMAYLVNVTWELPLVLGIVFAIATTALLGILLEKIDVGADAPPGRRDAAAAADVDRPRLRDPLRDPVRLGDRAAPARRQQDRHGRTSSTCGSGAPS